MENLMEGSVGVRRKAGQRARNPATRYIISFVCISILFVLYALSAPREVYAPSIDIVAIFALVLWGAVTIGNGYARAICVFWALWFVIGSISLFAQNQGRVGLNYAFNTDLPNEYYLLCVGSTVLAIKIAEFFVFRNSSRPPVDLKAGNNPWVWLILVIFPFFYALSIVFATGGIPIFSGRDVSAEMYQVDYGPLHAFGIFVTISCVAVWEKLYDRASIWVRSYPMRSACVVFLCLLILIAAMDGRRVLAVFALFAMIIFSSAQPAGLKERLRIGGVAVLALLGYVVASALRTGHGTSSAFTSIWKPLATVGVEYRDFCYALVQVNRNQVLNSGYDWLGSTLATIVPGVFLKALGCDKNSMVIHDSARTLMPFWNVKLGIRIGLPGELWLAYEWWGVAVFAIYGLGIYVLCAAAIRSGDFINRAALLALLGLGATAVMGQSTVTFGLFLPVLYLMLVFVVINFFTKKRRGGAYGTGISEI